jgi:hypothetical protein
MSITESDLLAALAERRVEPTRKRKPQIPNRGTWWYSASRGNRKTVLVGENVPGGKLYLLLRERGKGHWRWIPLGHKDRTKAMKAARLVVKEVVKAEKERLKNHFITRIRELIG